MESNCPFVDVLMCTEPCIIFSNRRGCQECVCPVIHPKDVFSATPRHLGTGFTAPDCKLHIALRSKSVESQKVLPVLLSTLQPTHSTRLPSTATSSATPFNLTSSTLSYFSTTDHSTIASPTSLLSQSAPSTASQSFPSHALNQFSYQISGEYLHLICMV